MLGGVNPAQLKGMMKKLGIKQEDIDAQRVIIEKSDGGRIIIEDPSVAHILMQGQESWQITGNATEEESEAFKEEDVDAVMEKTGASKEDAIKALTENEGDLAEAILSLS